MRDKISYATVKCKWKSIEKKGVTNIELLNGIQKADKIYKLCILFVRAYILHLYETDQDIPIIDDSFLRAAIKVVTHDKGNGQGRPLCEADKQMINTLNDYYNKIFKLWCKIHLTDHDQYVNSFQIMESKNLSYIFTLLHNECLTSIKNNIYLHAYKHLRAFINATCESILNSKLQKIKPDDDKTTQTPEQKQQIKLTRQEHYKNKKVLIDDIMNNTKEYVTKCPDEYQQIFMVHRCKLLPITNHVSKIYDPLTILNTSWEDASKKCKLDIVVNYMSWTDVLESKKPCILLRNLIYINRYFEDRGKYTYQVFPIKTKTYTNHIKITSQVLVEIYGGKHGKSCQGIRTYEKELWAKYFDLGKMYLKDHSFNYEISTNGYDVSINFIPNKDIQKQNYKTENLTKGRQKLNAKIDKIFDARIKEYDNSKKQYVESLKDEDIKAYVKTRKLELSKIKETIKIEYQKEAEKAEAEKSKAEMIKYKEATKKKREEYAKLSDEEKQKIKLEQELNSEFPTIKSLAKSKGAQKWLQEQRLKRNLVVADPGKRSILFMAGDKKKVNVDTIMKDGERSIKNHVFFNYTNKMRLKETKRIKYNKLIEHHKAKTKINDKSIQKLEEDFTNCNSKSCYHYKFIRYIATKERYEMQLKLGAYTGEYMKKLKWFGYLNKRRHEDMMLSRIEKTYGSNAVFIIGDWSSQDNLQFISTPNIGFKRKLKEKFKVFLVNEYNTSKLHYKSGVVCENLSYPVKDVSDKKTIWIRNKRKWINKRNGRGERTKKIKKMVKRVKRKRYEKKEGVKDKVKREIKTRSLHSVLTYKMENNVMGCINRDKNACMNMRLIVETLIMVGEKPERFRREKKTTKPMDVYVNPSGAEKVHIEQDIKQKEKTQHKDTTLIKSKKTKPKIRPLAINPKIKKNIMK